MKTIERQIRNHTLAIELHSWRPVGDPPDENDMAEERYRVDGTRVHRDAFIAIIALLGAEAPL